jgi:putative phage-type endonuclease
MKLQNTNKLSHDEWLELRQKGIGGSDIGSIFGLNPYKSAIQLWLEKTGQIESPDISNKLQVKLGNMLEDTVAQLFTEETGLEVKRNNHVLQHNDYPFMLANIDREGKDKEGKRFILECKTTSSYGSKQWADDNIPLSYELQVMHYLIVTGYEYGYIACLIGNHDFVVKKIELDELIKKRII